MKWYIRHFNEKHWYNIFLEGNVFFWYKRFGFYAMHKKPAIYLRKIANNIKSIVVLNSSGQRIELTPIKNCAYYELNTEDIIEIEYTNGDFKRIAIIYTPSLHAYSYVQNIV